MDAGKLTQIQRYKNTIQYIHNNFKENIDIESIEKVSFYSYRNINRIFLSLHHETIGKYVKRIRLEKAAEYIKYSDRQLSDIALEVGFSDLAAFSKAFKKKFNCSPILFRQSNQQIEKMNRAALELDEHKLGISFQIETLPNFNMLYLQHRGDYSNIKALEKSWDLLLAYCEQQKLLTDNTIFLSEMLDDNAISDQINCRTNIAITLDQELNFEPGGLFQLKTHSPHRYAKFIHKGQTEYLEQTYNHIFSAWMTEVRLEFADLPILEFYINHNEAIPSEQYITEIYIPIE
ncbi:MAG: AraC family transcriptional regulator [Bacteroidota bacterium]